MMNGQEFLQHGGQREIRIILPQEGEAVIVHHFWRTMEEPEWDHSLQTIDPKGLIEWLLDEFCILKADLQDDPEE